MTEYIITRLIVPFFLTYHQKFRYTCEDHNQRNQNNEVGSRDTFHCHSDFLSRDEFSFAGWPFDDLSIILT